MKIEIFAVYDSILNHYHEPFNARTIERAKVIFTEVVNNPQTDMHKFSEEYTLFHLGSYDMDLGLMMPLPAPVPLGLATQFKFPTVDSQPDFQEEE